VDGARERRADGTAADDDNVHVAFDLAGHEP
jgi:hypothetical protein